MITAQHCHANIFKLIEKLFPISTSSWKWVTQRRKSRAKPRSRPRLSGGGEPLHQSGLSWGGTTAVRRAGNRLHWWWRKRWEEEGGEKFPDALSSLSNISSHRHHNTTPICCWRLRRQEGGHSGIWIIFAGAVEQVSQSDYLLLTIAHLLLCGCVCVCNTVSPCFYAESAFYFHLDAQMDTCGSGIGSVVPGSKISIGVRIKNPFVVLCQACLQMCVCVWLQLSVCVPIIGCVRAA